MLPNSHQHLQELAAKKRSGSHCALNCSLLLRLHWKELCNRAMKSISTGKFSYTITSTVVTEWTKKSIIKANALTISIMRHETHLHEWCLYKSRLLNQILADYLVLGWPLWKRIVWFGNYSACREAKPICHCYWREARSSQTCLCCTRISFRWKSRLPGTFAFILRNIHFFDFFNSWLRCSLVKK